MPLRPDRASAPAPQHDSPLPKREMKTDLRTGLPEFHMAIARDNLAEAKAIFERVKNPLVPDRFGRMPSVVACECDASDELTDWICEEEAKLVTDD